MTGQTVQLSVSEGAVHLIVHYCNLPSAQYLTHTVCITGAGRSADWQESPAEHVGKLLLAQVCWRELAWRPGVGPAACAQALQP